MNRGGMILAAAGLALIAIIVAVVLGTMFSNGGRTLVIATSTDYPPFSYLDEQGQPAGFDYQYGNMLCEALGATCSWRTGPFEEVFERTRRGEFDLTVNSFTRTEYRERLVGFSAPYYRSYGQFVRLAGSQAELDETSTVAVQSGTIYERYLETPELMHVATIAFENQEDAFRAVAEGKADLTIADDVITDLAVNGSPFLGDGKLGEFERVGEPIMPLEGTPEFEALGAGEIGVIVPLENVDLLADINRAIGEINRGGAMAEVSRGYFGRNILAR